MSRPRGSRIFLDQDGTLRGWTPRVRRSPEQLATLARYRQPAPRWVAGRSANPRGHRLGSRYRAPDRPVGRRHAILTAEALARGVAAAVAARDEQAEQRELRRRVRTMLATPERAITLLEMLSHDR